jgi:hypothetical protein
MILKTIGTFRGLQSLPALVEFSWHLQDDMKYLDTSLQMTFPIRVYPSSPAIDEGNEWDPLQKVYPNTAFLVNTHYAGTFTSVRKEGNNNILTMKIYKINSVAYSQESLIQASMEAISHACRRSNCHAQMHNPHHILKRKSNLLNLNIYTFIKQSLGTWCTVVQILCLWWGKDWKRVHLRYQNGSHQVNNLTCSTPLQLPAPHWTPTDSSLILDDQGWWPVIQTWA